MEDLRWQWHQERLDQPRHPGADPSATSGTWTATVTTRYAFDTEKRLCQVLENATVDLASLADPCTTPVSGTTTQDVSTRYTYDGLGNTVNRYSRKRKLDFFRLSHIGESTTLLTTNSSPQGVLGIREQDPLDS